MTADLGMKIAGIAVGLLCGGFSVGGVAFYFMRRMVEKNDRRQERLETEVTHLRDDEVKELKDEFRACRDRCVGAVVKTKLEIVIAQNNEILRDMKKVDRETARQGQSISELDDHVKRLHGSHSKHMEKYHAAV